MAFGVVRSRPVSEVDVVNVYKIFLGRTPESQAVINEKSDLSLEDFIANTINADECLRQVIGYIVSGDISNWSRYQTALGPDVNLWARDVFGIDVSAHEIRQNKYWAQLILYIIAAMRADPDFNASDHIVLSAQFEGALLRWCEAEKTSSIIGAIDLCDVRRVMGWVLDRDDLDAALIVEIFANGHFIGAARADKFRRELQATYGGGGIFGFSIDLKNTFDANDGRPVKIDLVESVTRKIFASTNIAIEVQHSLDLLYSIDVLLRDIKEKINKIELQIPAIRNVTSFSVESYNAYAEAYSAGSPRQKTLSQSYWEHATFLPLISIIIIVDENDIEHLDKTIESVVFQSYKSIELIIAYTKPRGAARARPWIDALLARLDAPTRQLWPETAVNHDAILSAAIAATKGDLVCQIQSGDLLAERAMHQIAKAACEQPDCSVYLSDEDEFNRISDTHILYHSPKFNPEYDPLLLAQVDLFGGVIAARGDLIRALVSWPRPAGQESIGLMRESPVEDAWLRRQTVTVQTYLFPIPI